MGVGMGEEEDTSSPGYIVQMLVHNVLTVLDEYETGVAEPTEGRGRSLSQVRSRSRVAQRVYKWKDPNDYRFGAWSRAMVMCRDTADSGTFVSVVTVSILIAGVIVGVDAEFPGADVDPYPTPTTSMGGADVGLLLW